MRTSVKLISLEHFDRELPRLQQAAASSRGIRKSLGMSMRAFSLRIHFKEPASVKELERNESAGTITLQTLRRAAEAMDADFVYAIVPRKRLRETVAARARAVAEQRLAPIVKSMALEEQGLTGAEIARQIDELARELEQKPEALWR